MAKDTLQQLEKQISSYVEMARRVLRRWWLIAIFTVVGAGVSIGMALSMARIYQSRSLVEYKEVVQDRRAFTGADFHRQKDWLRTSLRETFESNTFLMTMMRQLNLFPERRRNLAPEDVLLVVRNRAAFGMVGPNSFWISFEHKDPRKAQQATAYLTDEFIRRNVQNDLSSAQRLYQFMKIEAEKSVAEMNKIEREVAQFVSDNPEYRVLPGSSTPSVTTDPSTPAHTPRAVYGPPALRRALAQKGRLEAQLQIALRRSPQEDPAVAQAQEAVSRAERRLAALRRKYTARHPDVQSARFALSQVQAQLRRAQSASASADSSSRAAVARLRDEIAALDKTIAQLSRSSTPHKKASPKASPKDALQSRKARLENQWYKLSRDREVIKAKHDNLQERLTRARITANLERKQAETQFSIIDKANLPRKPVRPNRTKLAMAGTALGFMLGLALAVLLMIFDGRIFNEQDLKKVCDLPVLAQIPRET